MRVQQFNEFRHQFDDAIKQAELDNEKGYYRVSTI
ncbi:hypothetical protein H710_00625 [Bartonella bacilliformis Ver097]|uniref:Uncharacterized protein n=1 Tax=Bartonella bacilliformis Ver097 TaxID=1293911 RepID=A0A072REU9_BARBA|nr:hypothetical protein H710_00625 [Bartonella bacilliformis Ver097]